MRASAPALHLPRRRRALVVQGLPSLAVFLMPFQDSDRSYRASEVGHSNSECQAEDQEWSGTRPSGIAFFTSTASPDAATFCRGNFTSAFRYSSVQASNLSFEDSIKKMFPKYTPKQHSGRSCAVNMASGGLAAASSLTLVKTFDGLSIA